MYMSRVEIDLNKRETQRAYNQPHYFHRSVEDAFPGPRARRLWRLDSYQGKAYLIIVSDNMPNLSQIANDFGTPSTDRNSKTVDYKPFLAALSSGQTWHFRFTGNPVAAVKENNGRGVQRAHVTPEQQILWLVKRADKLGVEFKSETIQVVNSKWFRFKKNEKDMVTFRQVSFEGLLKITNNQRVVEALTKGIGRQKAYGCGLLTLARPF